MSTLDEKKSLKMIPVAKPWFSEEETRQVAEALSSGWVAQGPKVKAFEKGVAEYVGVPYAIAANSCTSALQLGLEVLGVGPGDEVIIPSFTFIATANSVMHCGAKPVFVDIDPETYNINPELIEKAVTSRTKVIMPVDQIGLPADLDAIRAIASKKGIPILEDAACALGSEYNGRKVGGISDISCFSFHPRKLITTGEGGMITTSNSVLAEACRVKVSHGASISDLARHQSSRVVFEEYGVTGHNFRMSDLQAAVGLAQLVKLQEILKRKRFFAERYNAAFGLIPEIAVPIEPQGLKTNFQSYMIRIQSTAKMSRDEIMQELLEKNISTRRGIMAIHLEPAYQKISGTVSLPETERAFLETMILPLYAEMTVEEQDRVIDGIKQALAG